MLFKISREANGNKEEALKATVSNQRKDLCHNASGFGTGKLRVRHAGVESETTCRIYISVDSMVICKLRKWTICRRFFDSHKVQQFLEIKTVYKK